MFRDHSTRYYTKNIQRLLLTGLLPAWLICGFTVAQAVNLDDLLLQKLRYQLKLDASADISPAVEQQRQRLTEFAANNPTQKRKARIFFKRGLSAEALKRFFARKPVMLRQVEGKVRLPASNTVLTVWFRHIQSDGVELAAALNRAEVRHAREIVARRRVNTRNKTRSELAIEKDIFLTRKNLQYVEAQVIADNWTLAELFYQGHSVATVALIIPGDVVTDEILATEWANDVVPSPTQAKYRGVFSGSDGLTKILVDSAVQGICGPSTGFPESNCPPDENWVPSPKVIAGAANSVVSIITNYTYTHDSQQSTQWSSGSFYSRFRWSTNPVNTAAFKDHSLKACKPSINPFITCKDQNDVIYIPKATYEDEGHVPNPACSLLTRTGTSWDRQFGCFVADYAWSNLPYAYLDTALLDGQSYIATIGSFQASAVVPGTTYVHYQSFWGWGHNKLTELGRLNHSGQIGTAYCSFSPAMCTFSVDTTHIHKNLPYIPVVNSAR